MATGSLTGAAAAREAARSILKENRFHVLGVPRPLHGLLESIGHALESPFTALNRLIDTVSASIPGGVPGAWAALALAVFVATALVARLSARSALSDPGAIAVRDDGPAALEREAAAAEAQGRFGEAVRLRFRAGLLRLAERRLIPSGRTLPTHEVSRALHSERFDALARRFDEIAYGGSPATERDVADQRQAWPRILDGEARR